MPQNSQQFKVVHTHTQNPLWNHQTNKNPPQNYKQILYLKSLSIWSYLRNLTMDPVYEIWITLKQKAILHENKRNKAAILISHFSIYTPELNKQSTGSLRSSLFISWTGQCLARILVRIWSIYKCSCCASQETEHLSQQLLKAFHLCDYSVVL